MTSRTTAWGLGVMGFVALSACGGVSSGAAGSAAGGVDSGSSGSSGRHTVAPTEAGSGGEAVAGSSGSSQVDPTPQRFACSNPTVYGGKASGLELCDNGMLHRVSSGTCEAAATTEGCMVDADCPPINGFGSICVCDELGGGSCVQADCSLDADCPEGGACIGATTACSGNRFRFACQGSGDECDSDADCASDPANPNCTWTTPADAAGMPVHSCGRCDSSQLDCSEVVDATALVEQQTTIPLPPADAQDPIACDGALIACEAGEGTAGTLAGFVAQLQIAWPADSVVRVETDDQRIVSLTSRPDLCISRASCLYTRTRADQGLPGVLGILAKPGAPAGWVRIELDGQVGCN